MRVLKFAAACACLAGAALAEGPQFPRELPRADGPILPPGVVTLTTACGGLASLAIPDATIVSAEMNVTGAFGALTDLPPFCRVVAAATPTPDSLIGMEVWIPTGSAYRQRYLQIGNGGFSGAIDTFALADAIRRGYAAAATDDGNQVFQSPAFAVNAEKRIDYGWRSLSETNRVARALIAALKGADPLYSYFQGCSNGGRQALMVAQRFPEAFDGVIAGAPANFYTHQFASFAWNAQQVYRPLPDPATPPRLPASKLSLLTTAVLNQCAGRDGGLPGDRFLTNPPACRVDLSALRCGRGISPSACLTTDEIAVVAALYKGPTTASGAQIYPGLEPGAEALPGNWPAWLIGPASPEWPFGIQSYFAFGFYGWFVNGGAPLDIRSINVEGELADIDSNLGPILNSVEPDLRAFRNRGGKLLQYHGWDDAAVAPRNSINYWASVEASLKSNIRGFSRANLDAFYRLFMAPGLSHCAGGPGATTFQGDPVTDERMDPDHDMLTALERWVETGAPPDRIVARHAPAADDPSTFERPLCPYPKLPKYSGAGLETDAASWICAAPPLKFQFKPKPMLKPPYDVIRIPRPLPDPPPVER